MRTKVERAGGRREHDTEPTIVIELDRLGDVEPVKLQELEPCPRCHGLGRKERLVETMVHHFILRERDACWLCAGVGVATEEQTQAWERLVHR